MTSHTKLVSIRIAKIHAVTVRLVRGAQTDAAFSEGRHLLLQRRRVKEVHQLPNLAMAAETLRLAMLGK